VPDEDAEILIIIHDEQGSFHASRPGTLPLSAALRDNNVMLLKAHCLVNLALEGALTDEPWQLGKDAVQVAKLPSVESRESVMEQLDKERGFPSTKQMLPTSTLRELGNVARGTRLCHLVFILVPQRLNDRMSDRSSSGPPSPQRALPLGDDTVIVDVTIYIRGSNLNPFKFHKLLPEALARSVPAGGGVLGQRFLAARHETALVRL